MPTKKSNIQSVNLNDKAVMVLQLAGYINKRKRSTGNKNLSKFLSELVINHFNAKAEKVEHIAHAIALKELTGLQQQQRDIEAKIHEKVNTIRRIRQGEQTEEVQNDILEKRIN